MHEDVQAVEHLLHLSSSRAGQNSKRKCSPERQKIESWPDPAGGHADTVAADDLQLNDGHSFQSPVRSSTTLCRQATTPTDDNYIQAMTPKDDYVFDTAERMGSDRLVVKYKQRQYGTQVAFHFKRGEPASAFFERRDDAIAKKRRQLDEELREQSRLGASTTAVDSQSIRTSSACVGWKDSEIVEAYCSWSKELVSVQLFVAMWEKFHDTNFQTRYRYKCLQLITVRVTCVQMQAKNRCNSCNHSTWHSACLSPSFFHFIMPLPHHNYNLYMLVDCMASLRPIRSSSQKDCTEWRNREPNMTWKSSGIKGAAVWETPAATEARALVPVKQRAAHSVG